MSGSRRWCDRARRSPVAPSRSWWPTTASAWSGVLRAYVRAVRHGRAFGFGRHRFGNGHRQEHRLAHGRRSSSGNAGGEGDDVHGGPGPQVALDPGRCWWNQGSAGKRRAGRGVGKKARRRFRRRHGEAASLSTPSVSQKDARSIPRPPLCRARRSPSPACGCCWPRTTSSTWKWRGSFWARKAPPSIGRLTALRPAASSRRRRREPTTWC